MKRAAADGVSAGTILWGRLALAVAAVVAAIGSILFAGHLLLDAMFSTGPVRAHDVASARKFFHHHEAEFVELAQLMQGGQPALDTAQSAKLRKLTCELSTDCRASYITDEHDSNRALYLAAWLGVPDDSAGFAHFPGKPTGGPYSPGGMLICPIGELGDGWWWLDRPASYGPRMTCPASS